MAQRHCSRHLVNVLAAWPARSRENLLELSLQDAELYHPLFNAHNFRNGATTDKFFLCLEALDPKFDLVESKEYLQKFEPVSIVEVEY